tara:strand:- start:6601 stop:9561 length:2961 start_codon:yes stop_codon:yes gene_type:complete
MEKFKKLNNIFGWAIFGIATFVYLTTMEKTASLWDCGEFISAAYKLEVVHAPGAPFFLLLGRIFTLFASDPSQVPIMINSLSALASSFTILFLFWTITAFGRKILFKDNDYEISKIYSVLGSGAVGALAYTFSDSFWFSAVEGEVYALSSFFTAVTFWCILKWEQVADSPHSSKWLVLIAYLIGLSIGVHLLSLLTIPAMGMIYYFKNNEYSHIGALKALSFSTIILVFIQGIFIPKTASLMGNFDRVFVNEFGLPFNSGLIFFFLIIIGLIIYGLIKTEKFKNSTWNTAILGVLVLLIGYSSYASVIIRSTANTPINIGSPDDPLKLSSYLQRDQYGDWPILFGQQYNHTGLRYENDKIIYEKNKEKGIYEKVGESGKIIYKEKSEFFPRMWSSQKKQGYNRWRISNGKNPNSRITFGENLRFFIDYQIGWSYFRYFMWNFTGRQNDIMNMDQNDVYGNWESGIGYSDENMPSHLKNNKGKNHYYFLPLIIGLIGVYYHFKSSKKDALSVLMFFLFTGVLIIVFLNVPPDQPRERDYAYVGSFYAFSIWIGLGVLSIYDQLKTKINPQVSSITTTILCLICAPLLMASENWDDHDRTGRTITIDVAKNYLEHLAPNALIFTNGDNDTYPLWYAQEVEQVRPDVRVVNMSLLGMDWYINQVKFQVYDAAPVPSLLKHKHYQGNSKNGIPVYKNKKPISAINAIKEIRSSNRCPKNIIIKIDTNKIPKNDLKLWRNQNIVEEIQITIKGSRILQSEIALLDILSNFRFNRPIYFISAQQTLEKFSMIGKGNSQTIEEVHKYIGLMDFVQEEGAVSRLVPYRTGFANIKDGKIDPVNINEEITYDLLLNKYQYGNINKENVYYDYYSARSIVGFRYPFLKAVNRYLELGENKKAIELAEFYFNTMPISTDVLDGTSTSIASVFVKTNHTSGYKWIDLLLEEYLLQKEYIKNLEIKGGFLSSDGRRLLEYTNQNIKQLESLKSQVTEES